MITNPILPGFHADPSICRVPGADGVDDYYIATSTFEWWPAVRIHHSRDLKHWRHHSYAVTRTSQLDLLGQAHTYPRPQLLRIPSTGLSRLGLRTPLLHSCLALLTLTL